MLQSQYSLPNEANIFVRLAQSKILLLLDRMEK